nr:DUF302 domain-containing protein [Vibrio vulnificus]
MYGFSTQFAGSYEQAITKVTEELAKEGFGILTEIDVKATLKKKIDVDRKPYVILGACNPHLANQAIPPSQTLAYCCRAMWWCGWKKTIA